MSLPWLGGTAVARLTVGLVSASSGRYRTRELRDLVIVLAVVAVTAAACGTTERVGDGVVGSADVAAIGNVLRARADAMGRGDREAFLATIDSARPVLRRTQLQEFEDPNQRASVARSTFKVAAPSSYLSYVRVFVEEELGGGAFPRSFSGPSNVRRYFRRDGGRWFLSEPTGDELGPEQLRTVRDVELSYWKVDDDLVDLYIAEAQAARDLAVRSAPAPVDFTYRLTVIPTAAAAGPGWNAFAAVLLGPPARFFPTWWALDADRRELAVATRSMLQSAALVGVRKTLLPGIDGRMSTHQWLKNSDVFFQGIDLSMTIRQTCAGVPPPTLRQLNDGPPELGTPGVSGEVWGRFYAYSWSLTGYLVDAHGKDGYWRLLGAIQQKGATPAAFTDSLGVSEDDLYAGWLAWSKKRYC